jgi:alpha-tubulin suppressor-like RCC1 family protein
LRVLWAVTGGTGAGSLSNTTATSATFMCLSAGPVLVSATPNLADGGNNPTGRTATVLVNCDPGSDAGVAAASVGGGGFGCALTAGGSVECWGDNKYGELGNNSSTSSSVPVPVTGLAGDATAVSEGAGSACALTAAAGVLCWGENFQGKLGDNSISNSSVPVPVTNLSSCIADISMGDRSACALTQGGGVLCWGDNSLGELGNGSDTVPSSPVPVPVFRLASGVTGVSVGFDSACAVTAEGSVWCWGSNYEGQLGNSSISTFTSVPVEVTGITNDVTAVSVGYRFACAVTAGGAVWCWGESGNGQLGISSSATQPCPFDLSIFCSLTPVQVTGLTSGVTAVSAGIDSACALTGGGDVLCWGYNGLGSLGNGSEASSFAPVQVTGLTSGVTGVSVGGTFACAVTTDGGVRCWGSGALQSTPMPTCSGTPCSLVPVSVIGF